MLNNKKNETALKLLVNELGNGDMTDTAHIRLQCRIVIATCFLLEMELHQLPLSNDFRGNLSEYRKKEFLEQYLTLYLDSEGDQYCSVINILEHKPSWLHLLRTTDVLIGEKGCMHAGDC
ncbi:MAG: hypothetical protein GX639_00580 [Fibrobacter sp.]|nr:hypothetical protein [Fibrobacter sp.]